MASIASELLRDRGDNSRIRSGIIHVVDAAISHLAKPESRPAWEAKLKKAERPAIPDAIDLAQLYPSWHGTFLAPAGYRPHGEGFGSYRSSQVSYGYYQGLENANTVAAIQLKVTELQSHPEMALLLPDTFFDRRCSVDFSGMKHGITMNWGFPYFGKGIHSESVRKPLCDSIHEQYTLEQPPSLENFGYGLWVAKSAESTHTSRPE
jgi:hypothetical protein